MLSFLIEKEFKQIGRNPFLPKLIVFMPILMMLVLPFAANQEIKEIKLSIVDNAHSGVSQRLSQKIVSSGYFKLTDNYGSYEQAMKSIEACKSDIILEIPYSFDRDLVKESNVPVLISANAVNGVQAGLGSSYLSSVLSDFSTELRQENGAISSVQSNSSAMTPRIDIKPQFRFNPKLDYKFFMVPALMVMLLTMLSGFLPALNIVGEKEKGTIEQINVSPVTKNIFIISKLIPYWIIGFVVLSFCVLLAFCVYGLVPSGSLLTIYIFALIYILVVSGMGLVISNYSNTMQQAMFVMFFFMMILLLMSGLFTPVNSMPQWAQHITTFNPLKYFMQVMRLVYLKGSSFTDLWSQFFTLLSFAVILNGWAILSYKKTS